MHETLTLERLDTLRGSPVMSSDGETIGNVEEIFYDEQTRQPEWIGIGTGFLGSKRVLVPVQGADVREDAFYVPYSKDQVRSSPDVDGDEISQQTEAELYSYYGLPYSEARSDTGLPEGGTEAAMSAPDTSVEREGEVVRSEEELRVGKQQAQTGRARLRKWVETEPVQVDVELQRETARVTREQIDEPVGDAAMGDQEVEVELRGEQPVAQKQAVAKERVGLEKDVQTDVETVTDEVQKERVELEGDVDQR